MGDGNVELRKRYEELRETHTSILQKEPPEELFHYTTSKGLLGMLEGDAVWATNLWYMSDYSELTYAEDIISQVAGEILEKEESEIARTALERIVEPDNPFRGLYDVYAFCLFEDPNELGIWRAYADDGAGYSVGFETRLMAQEQLSLVPVIYDREKQIDIIRNIVEDGCEVLEEYGSLDGLTKGESFLQKFESFARNTLAPFLLAFKDNAFEAESEWRAVYQTMNIADMPELGLADIEFRASPSGVLPYVELEIGGDDEPLPISSIRLGPQVSPGLQKDAISTLLQMERTDSHMIEINESEIPLRA